MLACSLESRLHTCLGLLWFPAQSGWSLRKCQLLPRRCTSLDWVSCHTTRPFWISVGGVDHRAPLGWILQSCHPCTLPTSPPSLIERSYWSSSDRTRQHSSTWKVWRCTSNWLVQSWMLSLSVLAQSYVSNYTRNRRPWMIVPCNRLNYLHVCQCSGEKNLSGIPYWYMYNQHTYSTFPRLSSLERRWITIMYTSP